MKIRLNNGVEMPLIGFGRQPSVRRIVRDDKTLGRTRLFNEIYRAMETEYRAGKLRAIGVSNFLESNFERLMRTAEIIPAVNQLETHVFRQQRGIRSMLAKYDTVLEAWSPLAAGQNRDCGRSTRGAVCSIGGDM